MNRKAIIEELIQAIVELKSISEKVDDKTFFEAKNGKWNAAENIEHLILSVKPINMAMKLPKFVLLVLFGKPKSALKSYDEIVALYQKKLHEGAVASRSYVPKQSKASKKVLVEKLEQQNNQLCSNIQNWSEDALNTYQLPHPIIGKITVREMLYFTLYHVRHHSKTIAG